MHRIQNILVATDYSEQARRAETRAAMLSVELKASTLEILAVQETRMGLNTPATASESTECDVSSVDSVLVENRLPVSLAHSVDALQCIRSLAVGKPATAIAKRADELDSDLTIVAARSKKFVPAFFTRDGNDELVRLSTRPVLLVHTDPDRAYAKVLVAVDFSEESKEAARHALAVAPSAHFTFLHACQVPDEGIMRESGLNTEAMNASRMALCEEARGELNLFIDQLGTRKQLITRAIHYGQTVSVLCDYAKRMRADLIAIGRHGKSRFVERLLGNTAQRLMDRTTCDLLVTSTSPPGGWDDRPAA
ncbi:universal stress protein [Noviherbaspirillum saxi]|nr:universal stress protein [Noviherbaspirillum saxi]